MNQLSFERKIKDVALKAIVYISAALISIMLAALLGFIIYKGCGYISWEFLTSKPSLIRDTNGILPNILNTVYLVLFTLCIVLPVGVGAAIYLNEYAKNKKAVKAIELATETLAGIPSIIYGLVGLLIFVRFFSFGTGLIAGACTLSVMTLPTIIRTVQESLKTVSRSYREGAFALGSDKWYMIRTVVLPSSIDGIVTGCILAAGRVVGESAALLFTAGMANEIMNIFEALQPGSAGASLTVALYMNAKERGDFEAAFAIAAILVFISLIINLSAKGIARGVKKRI